MIRDEDRKRLPAGLRSCVGDVFALLDTRIRAASIKRMLREALTRLGKSQAQQVIWQARLSCTLLGGHVLRYQARGNSMGSELSS